ncbi:hypothetical protein [Marinovum sp.]|uniref:hypothetical protein n=1 Tax=Marinovum sp. TaxID=2024839 RepID=UPI003A8E477A
MLEMIMLLGTGLAAAGIAGMTGIGSPSGNDGELEAASVPTNEYHLGDDYEGGEGEDLLSQVRRMGQALDLGKFLPGSGDGEDAAAEEAESLVAEPAEENVAEAESFAAAPAAEPVEEAAADSALAEDDDLVDFDALLTSLEDEDEIAEIDADLAVAEDKGAEDISLLLDEAGAEEDTAATVTEVAEAEAEDPAEAEEYAEDEDDIPVITDFAAGSEQLLLMLPDGMDEDTSVEILQAGADGTDAEVVLTDGQGSVTAVIVAGAYGSLNAGDVVLEREA